MNNIGTASKDTNAHRAQNGGLINDQNRGTVVEILPDGGIIYDGEWANNAMFY